MGGSRPIQPQTPITPARVRPISTRPTMMRRVRSMVPTLAFIMTSRSASAPAFQRREQKHSAQHGEYEQHDLPVPAEQYGDRRPRTDAGYPPTNSEHQAAANQSAVELALAR